MVTVGGRPAGTLQVAQSQPTAPGGEQDTASRTQDGEWLAAQGVVEDPAATLGIWASVREEAPAMEAMHATEKML